MLSIVLDSQSTVVAATPLQLQNAAVRTAAMSSPTPPSTPSIHISSIVDPYHDLSQQQTQTNALNFCQFPDWDSERAYDDDPQIYIHYSIEWKVTLNNRAVMGPDTVQDTVLAPAAYWEQFIPYSISGVLQ